MPALTKAGRPVIKVASPSFSKNPFLRKELLKAFPKAVFNDEGHKLGDQTLIDYLAGAAGAVIGLERINDNILSRCPDLKIISKYGVGMDGIDLEACKRHGVKVAVSYGVNKTSVAELTLSFMISLMRNTFKTTFHHKEGSWVKDGGRDLTGKTVGIIGVGHIGKEVVRLLEPFRCKILVNDIIDQKRYYKQHGLIESSKDKIFKTADIVTVHTPLTSKTRGMVNEKYLSMMKSDAFLVNAARGEIVVERDLKNALKNGTISGAAIDVYETEPPSDKEFLKMAHLICTPHIGGNSQEAVKAMGLAAIANLKEYF